MQPEIQAVQAKYKGKRDSVSAQRMNEEMNVIYEKYGTSPTGGCLPLLIQMPILFALFRVINNIPAYITSVKEMFTGLVDAVMAVPGYAEIMQNFVTENKMAAINTTNATHTIMNAILFFLIFHILSLKKLPVGLGSSSS